MPGCFEHLEKSFSHMEFQFKKFFLPVKINCTPTENVKNPLYKIRKKNKLITYLSVKVLSTTVLIDDTEMSE